MNKWVQIILIAEHAAIALWFLFARDFARFLYFIGAVILLLGVLWMK